MATTAPTTFITGPMTLRIPGNAFATTSKTCRTTRCPVSELSARSIR